MLGYDWRPDQNLTGGSVDFGAAFSGVVAIAVIAIGRDRGRLDAGYVGPLYSRLNARVFRRCIW
jgi:hypothetical protein